MVAAPIVVTKVDDKGTSSRKDDRLLAGAHFEIRLDDGDGKFEPKTDDALVFEGVAQHGYLVFETPPQGINWIIEVDAPSGYDTAKPVQVRYPATWKPRTVSRWGAGNIAPPMTMTRVACCW